MKKQDYCFTISAYNRHFARIRYKLTYKKSLNMPFWRHDRIENGLEYAKTERTPVLEGAWFRGPVESKEAAIRQPGKETKVSLGT